MIEKKERAKYEAPAVTDFGSVEDLTLGQFAVNTNDFPLGAKVAGSLPVIGPLPPIPLPSP